MSANLIIAICGDSIAGCDTRWPFQIFGSSLCDCGTPTSQASGNYYSTRLLMKNMAISGTRLAGSNGVQTIRPIYVDPIYAVKTFILSGAALRRYLYINAIGSNDGAVGGLGTVAAYATAVATDIAAAKTAGADYGWICSLIARGDGQLTEPNRTAFNALVTDPSWRASNGVDDCIDLASATHAAPQFLPINSGGDTTWFQSDNVHPQPALSAEMGTIASAKFTALLATI